jgi:spermidine/putrescine transport system permease protein
VLTNPEIQDAAWNSLVIAIISTLAATIIALMAAIALTRTGRFRGQALTFGLISLPLVVPEIVTAVATLIFFSATGIALGIGNVILAHITFCIPFAFMPIRARLEGMDTTLEQAARDLYASEWQAFRHVTLPLLMPGVIAGAMLSFVISIDDFIITQMVSSAGTTTLPVYIYSMIRNGVTPEVNAISTILLAISVLIVTAYWLVSRSGAARS